MAAGYEVMDEECMYAYEEAEAMRPSSAPTLASDWLQREVEERAGEGDRSASMALNEDYALWYHSQLPRDPRLPAPVANSGNALAIVCAARDRHAWVAPASVAAAASPRRARSAPAAVSAAAAAAASPLRAARAAGSPRTAAAGAGSPRLAAAGAAAPRRRSGGGVSTPVPSEAPERHSTEGLSHEQLSGAGSSVGQRQPEDPESCGSSGDGREQTSAAASPPQPQPPRSRLNLNAAPFFPNRTPAEDSPPEPPPPEQPQQRAVQLLVCQPGGVVRAALPRTVQPQGFAVGQQQPRVLLVAASPPAQQQQQPQRGGPEPYSGHNERLLGGPRSSGPLPFRQHSIVRQRSSLYQCFRSSHNTAQWRLADLEGHVAEFAQDADGHKFLLRRLGTCSDRELDMVWRELIDQASDVTRDAHGNFTLQKVVECVPVHHREGLVRVLRGQFGDLALHPYGSRIVQKLVETLDNEPCDKMIQELEPLFLKLFADQHGNHVIQKMIERLPRWIPRIVAAIDRRIAEFATQGYGCRCVQRLLELCSDQQVIMPILEDVLQNVETLIVNQYANYVVQQVLLHGHPQYKFAIAHKLRGRYTQLSCHKIASNVVEKMFEGAGPQIRTAIIEELMSHRTADRVSGMVVASTDQYGNYVVQKAFELSGPSQRYAIAEHLGPHVNRIRGSAYAKHFAAKMERELQAGPPPRTVRSQFRERDHY
eukprot:TRINITY_DN6456_c0_g2_i1.p1 TRINITY_DN6456_c0_g2~~TRINITY_DN6456_c0_g2_i1.p1  ORF type:complete len:767 (+),score=237.83 TRINITY_DN6456_c0_g2_i1:180-2303(+)